MRFRDDEIRFDKDRDEEEADAGEEEEARAACLAGVPFSTLCDFSFSTEDDEEEAGMRALLLLSRVGD